MTTGERLVQLSGLPTGTAIEHLFAILVVGNTVTGDQLVDISDISTGTALEHLLATSTTPQLDTSGGAGKKLLMKAKEGDKRAKEELLKLYEDDKEIVQLIKIFVEWV